MTECPHVVKRTERLARCAKLSAAAGFICSVPHTHCAACQAEGGPSRPVAETRAMGAALKALLRGRLSAGDCPRYQGINPVDMRQAFQRFTELAKPAEQRELLQRMFLHQARIAESKGGHPVEVVVEKLVALAAKHDLDDALDDVAPLQAEVV